MARSAHPSAARPTPPLPAPLRPGRSRVRRQRLLATYDRLPTEAQGLLLALAGDLWRATRRRAAAQAARVADAPATHDGDRALLLATIRLAHEDRA